MEGASGLKKTYQHDDDGMLFANGVAVVFVSCASFPLPFSLARELKGSCNLYFAQVATSSDMKTSARQGASS